MDVNMPGEASAEGMQDKHDAREIALEKIPIRESSRNNGIEAVEIGSSANAKVMEEFVRGTKDHMLVFTVGKQGGVAFNPEISLPDTTRGTEP